MNFGTEVSWGKNEIRRPTVSVASPHTDNLIDIDACLQRWMVREEERHFFSNSWFHIILLKSTAWKLSKMIQEYHYLWNVSNWINGSGSPGSSIHGIFQARVLEWGAIAFSELWMGIWLKWIYIWQMCPYSVTQSCPTLRPHGLQPARLLCPWDFSGRNTGVGCVSCSRGSSRSRNWTMSPALQALLYHWTTGEAQLADKHMKKTLNITKH